MSDMKHIVWLPAWYPNELNPFEGDFIERHALSASLLHRVTVLFLVKDTRATSTQDYRVEEKVYNDRCRAIILYYRLFSRVGFLEAIFSPARYCVFLAELIRQHVEDFGRPDCLHVHVAWKPGLLALYCRWRYRIRYVVSEHWSGYMPGARPSFDQRNLLVRWFTRRIFRRAAVCSAVSHQLAQAMAERFRIALPTIIPNVVDTDLFLPQAAGHDVFRFIHVSEFNFQKNPAQIFEAMGQLTRMTDRPFELMVFAPDGEPVHALAKQFGVEAVVRYHPYVPQAVLADKIASSDALVLYSRYETFGCVVIEAMAAGIPSIVSDIPVMHEIVTDESGVFVPLDQPARLADRMLWMMEHRGQFDTAAMRTAVQRFSFEAVAKKFDGLYRQVFDGGK